MEMEYERIYDILRLLLKNHTYLEDSLWLEAVKCNIEIMLSYDEIVKRVDKRMAFRCGWEKGSFIKKIEKSMYFFENFNKKKLFCPSKSDLSFNDWVIAV